jgi:hypothetical protein
VGCGPYLGLGVPPLAAIFISKRLPAVLQPLEIRRGTEGETEQWRGEGQKGRRRYEKGRNRERERHGQRGMKRRDGHEGGIIMGMGTERESEEMEIEQERGREKEMG